MPFSTLNLVFNALVILSMFAFVRVSAPHAYEGCRERSYAAPKSVINTFEIFSTSYLVLTTKENRNSPIPKTPKTIEFQHRTLFPTQTNFVFSESKFHGEPAFRVGSGWELILELKDKLTIILLPLLFFTAGAQSYPRKTPCCFLWRKHTPTTQKFHLTLFEPAYIRISAIILPLGKLGSDFRRGRVWGPISEPSEALHSVYIP